MNRTILTGGLAALILATAGGVSLAQSAPEPTRTLRADTDRDRRVSRDEFVAGRVQRLSEADVDRDGSVSPEERRSAADMRRSTRIEGRFDRLDTNADGVLSRSEFEAVRKARGPRADRPVRAAGRAARPPVEIADAEARTERAFERLDRDADGYLTAEEGRAGRAAMRDQRRERRAARNGGQASPQTSSSE